MKRLAWLATVISTVIAAGHALAYDQETGFGLVQAMSSLDLPVLRFGSSREVAPGDSLIIAGSGGREAFCQAAPKFKKDGRADVIVVNGNPLEDLAPPHFGHLMAQAETTLDTGTGGAGGESVGGAGGAGGQPQGGSGGGGDGGESDDGCGCRIAAGDERASSALWLVLSLGLARRTRRTRRRS